jgi:hypothetical protein
MMQEGSRLDNKGAYQINTNEHILAILAVALLLLVGCAATPKVEGQRGITTELAQYSAVHVIVEAPEQIRQKSGYDATSAVLLQEFIANVKLLGKYATVGTESAKGKVLEARLTITDFNYVHGASRGLIGILGGRAILNITMTLKDKASNSVVGIVTVSDSSSHSQGVFSPTTGRQISAVAKELASKLLDK